VKYILSGQDKAKAAALAAEVLGITKPIEYACEHVLVHLKGGPKVTEFDPRRRTCSYAATVHRFESLCARHSRRWTSGFGSWR